MIGCCGFLPRAGSYVLPAVELQKHNVDLILSFLTLYSLMTLSRPSTADQYKSTLQVFQFLVMLLSCLAVAQFVAQFVVDGRKTYNVLWDGSGFSNGWGRWTSHNSPD